MSDPLRERARLHCICRLEFSDRGRVDPRCRHDVIESALRATARECAKMADDRSRCQGSIIAFDIRHRFGLEAE